MIYLQLAVPRTLFSLFTYKSDVAVPIGCRVHLSFGTSDIIGVVMGISETPPLDVPLHKLKPIGPVIDEKPYWNQQTLELIRFISRYQHAGIGAIIDLAQPVALRKGAPATRRKLKGFRLADPDVAPKNPQQARIVEALKVQPLSVQECRGMNLSMSAVSSLIRRGAVESFDLNGMEMDIYADLRFSNRLELNDEQRQAVDAISAAVGTFKVFLLQGVTGSGKTEVYMQAIEKALKTRKQVLVMIPEIGLTPQSIARFHSHFNVPIAAMHSALTDRERLDNYLSCRDGRVGILIGTRSSVFTPFKDLGMIIVDEEHDQSYKQQDTCRYNGRDLAIYKGKLASCPVILGSATPSLETVANAANGRYVPLRLSRRAVANAGKVQTEIIDLKGQSLESGLSPRVLTLMEEELKQDHQVLVFLNRRGYANQVICPACGHVLQCDACDSYLTYHKYNHTVNCHHCEQVREMPDRCPKCGAGGLYVHGNGTEQIEEFLRQRFPDYPSVRFDRDTMSSPQKLRDSLAGILNNEYRILIGTQILAKGHHFPNVTMIALLNIDGALFSNDFRATEHLAQLYTQVAGRTGREEKNGLVALQTYVPQNIVLQTIVGQGYDAFCQQCLAERRYLNLPPFTHQVLLRLESADRARVHQEAVALHGALKRYAENFPGVELGSPYQALMEKKQNKYHMLIMLQSAVRADMLKFIANIDTFLEDKKISTGVKCYVDVDPTEILQ
ncbi:MAG: primosomal protein N' [Succinivibrionaceae bacterium]|nr:primosomal protein N' [Succinivibrionaceae bacterium]